MDLRTQQILQIFKSHIRIKNFVTFGCYTMIVGGIFTYVFLSLNYRNNIKIVSNHKNNLHNFKIEKVITNPRINFQYNENQIYRIEAKKASHQSDDEATLFDVFASGALGKVTAGELKVSENGDHLVFSKNPVLILNQTGKNNKNF